MVGPLARYVARSPRYILQPEDNTLIRVAGPQQTPWEEGTEIQNVSLSGLAFTAPADLCPVIGEIIKIQFEAPGKAQMACFGLVSRLDRNGSTTVVGVKFLKLEFAQRVYLAQALSKKLKNQRVDLFGNTDQGLPKNPWKLAATWASLALWAAVNWFWMSGLWQKLFFWTHLEIPK